MEIIKKYTAVTKPGIIRGNVMTAVAGFLLASQRTIDFSHLFAVMAGVALVIGSACVFNNYIDRDIDKKMARTKNRALATGSLTVLNALFYAGLLGAAGFWTLSHYTNMLTVYLGIGAWFMYVVVYSVAKRSSPLGTLVGSIPGALAVTAGYTAVSNRLDTGAWLVFLVLVVWQMPHFYAIATYRLKDYKDAGLPVLPAVRGVRRTKISMVLYICLFVAVTSLLYVFGYAGYSYLIVMTAVGLWWLRLALKGFKAKDDVRWARKLFGFSLVVLLTFSLMISLTAWLP